MGYVEGVVGVDVAVGVFGEVVEDVGLEGVGGFHYEGVEVHPPEPVAIRILTSQKYKGQAYHSASGYFRKQFRMVSTFSQLSLHSCA